MPEEAPRLAAPLLAVPVRDPVPVGVMDAVLLGVPELEGVPLGVPVGVPVPDFEGVPLRVPVGVAVLPASGVGTTAHTSAAGALQFADKHKRRSLSPEPDVPKKLPSEDRLQVCVCDACV